MRFKPAAVFKGAHSRSVLPASLLLGIACFPIFSPKAHADDFMTRWLAPDIASPGVDHPHRPSIFGTIALPVRPQPTSTRWSKLMTASIDQPGLLRLTQGARDLPRQEQAAFVQSAVSHALRIRPATYNCSDDGYWASADETLARGKGDCFDIAIAKMEALRFLGVPSQDLYLTTGRFHAGAQTRGNRESVALLVRIGESFWLLTEQSDQIIEAGGSLNTIPGFTPILTYGVGSTWIHGRLVKIASAGNGSLSPDP